MDKNSVLESQRQLLLAAKQKGNFAQFIAFCRLSGPGWMQSATTLGGGSLATSLYLGVLGGFALMWLQPVAMILGIVMLSAISYVTLSLGDKPMHALNRTISPVLGYGWAAGSMLACLVFAMPQFSLVVAAIEQNLAADIFNSGAVDRNIGAIIITAFFFLFGFLMISYYAVGGKGIRFFEIFIKLNVSAIVVCFFGVAIKLSFSGAINWGAVFNGFIPDVMSLFRPSENFMVHLSQLGDNASAFWSSVIIEQQRDVAISACAMAVGINMTFLFPYSMLKKKWDKDFRGLAIFDLATGLFIPFVLASSCIIIAAATQFHAKAAAGLADARWTFAQNAESAKGVAVLAVLNGKLVPVHEAPSDSAVLAVETPEGVLPAQNLVKPYIEILNVRLRSLMGGDFDALNMSERVKLYDAMDARERTLAAMLVKRDASNLAETLEPLVGKDIARYVFGFGVMGMAMNAILMNMLICGLCFCEIFGKFGSAKWQLAGTMLILFSACASLFWEGAKMWLVIHAGVIAMILLPIAYGAFMIMLNNRALMGDNVPRGALRIFWNILMAFSVAASSCASLWVLWNKIGVAGPIIFVLFLVAVFVSYIITKKKSVAANERFV